MDTDRNSEKATSSRNWLTWAMLALLPGLTGWCIVLTQKQIQQNRTENYQEISRQQRDEFLQMYEEWNRLSAQEKADNPWGSGPYGGPDIQKKLMLHQEERLLADLPDLLTGSNLPDELGDILYGPGWRQRVEKYQKQIEYQEILSIFSSILLLTGGLVLLVGGMVWLRSVQRMRVSRKAASDLEASADSSGRSSKHKQKSKETREPEESSEGKEREEIHLFSRKSRLPSSGSSGSEKDPSVSSVEAKSAAAVFKEPAADSTCTAVSSMLGRAPSEVPGQLGTAVAPQLSTELKVTSSDPILSSLMTPIPVVQGLSDLSEQMSAIREFAAEQQNQVKKLQDGYDWMLIKRFCLRIIRCVDNLEDRIHQAEMMSQDVSVFQDIRDEILFALESSGVEQFEPEIGLDYRGLERYAEAVKEKAANSDPQKSGHIAEVVRPGYQYLINDEEVKIVRCAQVKLYA